MKLIKISNVILFGCILPILAIGCKTKSVGLTPLPSSSAAGSGTQAAKPGPGESLSDGSNKAGSAVGELGSNPISDPNLRKDWPRDREIFKSDTVHFDYDSSVIKADDKAKVAAVAEYIKSHASDALEIEGHCDVRGTEEYNRSLGERRALALRDELIQLGVEASRIDTVSFGEDRPVDTGHDEAAYKKNRRGEFLLEKHQTLAGLTSPINNDATK
jgi:peptidoglycan-associated lipoprotein